MRKNWKGALEYHFHDAYDMYVVYGWSHEDENGRGFGRVVEIAHIDDENSTRDFIWMIENPSSFEASKDTLEACKIAIELCSFPVGAIKAKVALQTAIDKARTQVTNRMEAKK